MNKSPSGCRPCSDPIKEFLCWIMSRILCLLVIQSSRTIDANLSSTSGRLKKLSRIFFLRFLSALLAEVLHSEGSCGLTSSRSWRKAPGFPISRRKAASMELSLCHYSSRCLTDSPYLFCPRCRTAPLLTSLLNAPFSVEPPWTPAWRRGSAQRLQHCDVQEIPTAINCRHWGSEEQFL